MAATLEQVVKQLTDSGIIAPGKLEPFIPPKADPKTVEELVQALVKSENLTRFQAQHVAAGKTKSLILGAYTILDKIGAGGMGQVFKAQHRKLKRLVAIKMLPPSMTKDAAAIARFEREVEAAAKLRHPNLVGADDAAEANGVHFLVMEYADGKDLSALVKRDGPIPVGKAVNYILQAARGLEFAHSKGVVHRDIKPANLLLGSDGVVKILDMGLARIEQAGGGEQAELTGTGTIMGTVDYMSPEQAVSTKNADQRADIYSLGMSLYYLLAGKAAYGGESAMEKLMAHQTQPIPSLQDTQTTVSKQLEAVFKKMAAKKMEDRYQTMNEVVEALESLGYGGSSTGRNGDVASTIGLSFADRKKLAKAKKPLGSITEVVASEKTKYFFAKMFGGAFGTIIAPILVFYLIRHLDKEDKPAAPPAATSPAMTVQPVAVATNTPTQPIAPASSDVSQPWNTPAFQAWVKATQALPAEQQVEAVRKKLMELNPGFDGKVIGADGLPKPTIAQGVVTSFGIVTDNVTDLSPVRALTGLKRLSCGCSTSAISRLSDLSPLEGLELVGFLFSRTSVAELTPLRGMPLTSLHFSTTPVRDLSPLVGMPLKSLICYNTRVSDLSPLAGMSLTLVRITPKNITTGMDVIRRMNSLAQIGFSGATNDILPPAEFWKKYDAGEFGKPAVANQPWNTPAFQAWVKATQALPAEQQIEAVSKKLMELNPGFDGKLTGWFDLKGTPTIQSGVVMQVGFATDNVTDISPVRALNGLKDLNCSGSGHGKGTLSDLSPLQGMSLNKVSCGNTQVSDLSPLRGIALTGLTCSGTRVSDLSPLKGMSLTYLNCHATNQVADLSPLQGMSITDLVLSGTQVSDLLPLRGMPLIGLNCGGTQVADVSPLQDCKTLSTLNVTKTKVTPAGVAALQKALPNCKIDWDAPAKLAYLDPAFQQWVKATQALPAEQQIEAVSKKLMELNPGYDGKVTGYSRTSPPKIEGGLVVEFGFPTDNVTDISPVRALGRLKSLLCTGIATDKGKLTDLSPLKGMPLARLTCANNISLANLSPLSGMLLEELLCAGCPNLSDLSPLAGMPLSSLNCQGNPISDLSPLTRMRLSNLVIISTQVSDLSPLQGMPLITLWCYGTLVSDLSPLNGMNLTGIAFAPSNISKGLDVIRQMKSLTTIGTTSTNKFPPAEFWKKYDAGEFGKPAAPAKLAYLDPTFQAWIKATQAMPAEKQIEAVSKKLMDSNPGFDGKVTQKKIESNVVTEFGFISDNVKDVSPVRAFVGLSLLWIHGSGPGKGGMSDLSPLEGMKLTDLNCGWSPAIVDLSPLKVMPLTKLTIGETSVSDLSPLAGLRLTTLVCYNNPISDLSPLQECKNLTSLGVRLTKVTPASVAALQKALPNCKIEWDDPAKPKTPEPAASGSK